MQIAIVTSEFGEKSGGLSNSCMIISNMLTELGHKVLIISSIDDNVVPTYCDFETIGSNLKIIDGGYKPKLKNHLFFRAHIQNVLSEISNKKIDFIVAFGAGHNGLFASELSRLTNIKLITMLRGSEINLSISDFELRQANYYCLKQSSKIVAVSNELLKRAKEIYFDAQIVYKVIPNITILPSKLDLCVKSKNDLVLGCGAYHLNEKKGVANLIEMLFHLNQMSDKNFHFEFIGNIDTDLLLKYRELCNTLKITPYVKFVKGLSRNQFLKRMQNWDFYVQGSFCEGFSNSVSDYMSLGKPFILTDTGFIAENTKEECKEFIFNNFIPKKMAETIIKMIDNKQFVGIYEKAFHIIEKLTNKQTVISLFSELFDTSKSTNNNFKSLNKSIISVLLHDISVDKYTNIDTPLNVFKTFVEEVANNGYILCSAKQYFESENRSNMIICTFDDAYSSIKKYALPILKQYGFTATMFVSYDYIGETNNWNLKDIVERKHLDIDELKELQTENWEIGSHGLTHNSLLRLSENDLEKELTVSKSQLSKIFGKINSYAYPYGDFNDYCKKRVSENYKLAFATTKGGTIDDIDNHQIRRYTVSELTNLMR